MSDNQNICIDILCFNDFINYHYAYNITKRNRMQNILSKMIINNNIQLLFNIVRGNGNCFINSLAIWLKKYIDEYNNCNLYEIVKILINILIPYVQQIDPSYIYDDNCPNCELLYYAFEQLFGINICIINITENDHTIIKQGDNKDTIFILLHSGHFTLIDPIRYNTIISNYEIRRIIFDNI